MYTGLHEFCLEKALKGMLVQEEMISLLFTSFKSLIRQRRKEIVEVNGCKGGDDKEASAIADYCWKIRSEIDTYCGKTMKLLDEFLLPLTSSEDIEFHLLLARADCLRYRAEAAVSGNWVDIAKESFDQYEDLILMIDNISCSHPARLHIAINCNALLKNVIQDKDQAFKYLSEISSTYSEEDVKQFSPDIAEQSRNLFNQLLKEKHSLQNGDGLQRRTQSFNGTFSMQNLQ